MDNASKNAKDMIGALTMQYNRGRQAAITNELVDIITGAFRLPVFVSLSPFPCHPVVFLFLFLAMCPSNSHPFPQAPALYKPRGYVRNKKHQ